ncbi:MAG: hypothetical protein AAGA73_07300 [Pseudomonadota bacterium]
MKRRHLIRLSALSLASLVLPKIGATPVRAHTLFTEMFGDDRLASHLGALHWQHDPLAGARGRSIATELASLRKSARHQRLMMRCQSDFDKLNIVTLDGWVMAQSEADLCAAVHLERKPR